MFPRFPVLPFPPLEFWSCVFRSCDFHPCDLVPRFPIPRLPFPRFQSLLTNYEMAAAPYTSRWRINRHAPDWSTEALTIACCNLRSNVPPMRSLRQMSPTTRLALSTTIRCLSPSVRNMTNVRCRENFSGTYGAEWSTYGSCTTQKRSQNRPIQQH